MAPKTSIPRSSGPVWGWGFRWSLTLISKDLGISGTEGNRASRANVRDNCADQVDCSNGNLTEYSELMFLNGQRFVLSLFPTGRTTFSTAGRSFWLGWQQVLGPTWSWRVRARVQSSWDGAGQLGFRFTHVLFLHVLGQASPVFASFTTLLLGSIWVHGGRVGLWGHTCPLEVTRVTLIAGWPWGHGPGRPNRTLGKQKMFPMERGYSGKCVPGKKKKVQFTETLMNWSDLWLADSCLQYCEGHWDVAEHSRGCEATLGSAGGWMTGREF